MAAEFPHEVAVDDTLAELSLCLSLRNFEPGEDEVVFKLNGRPLRKPRRNEPAGDVCRMHFPVYTLYTDVRREPPVSRGRNTIEATLVRRSPYARGAVKLVGVELAVRYQ